MTRGDVAIVTGAGSGMCRETAKLLGREMPVAVWDINFDGANETVAAITANGGTADAWRIDVVDRNAVGAAVREVNQRWGQVTVLVNGAGFGKPIAFLECVQEDWDRMLDVHLKGAFNCTQAVVPFMRDAGYGRIASIASVGAYDGRASHSHYSAAKAGIIGFSKALCREIGPWGITINCISPGAIQTPYLENAPADALTRFADNPVGRIGQPSDIAHALKFLVSREASFITGTVLDVNGGAYT